MTKRLKLNEKLPEDPEIPSNLFGEYCHGLPLVCSKKDKERMEKMMSLATPLIDQAETLSERQEIYKNVLRQINSADSAISDGVAKDPSEDEIRKILIDDLTLKLMKGETITQNGDTLMDFSYAGFKRLNRNRIRRVRRTAEQLLINSAHIPWRAAITDCKEGIPSAPSSSRKPVMYSLHKRWHLTSIIY